MMRSFQLREIAADRDNDASTKEKITMSKGICFAL